MRVAVVTGAAQGIGRVTAELFARDGWGVLLMDMQGCEATAAACREAGAEVEEVRGDLTAEETVRLAVERVSGRWGRVDALVNNAGISSIAPAEKTDAGVFRRVLEVNLVAPFVLSKAFGGMMLAQGEGAVVNVASIAGLVGVSDRVAYNASKHGLVGLTRTLAGEWGGRGVRVNAVCPGWVKTEMDEADQAGGGYVDADIEGRVPMGRFARPADIGQAILYLADGGKSGFVNGHTLVVDGGWTADGSWETLRGRKR